MLNGPLTTSQFATDGKLTYAYGEIYVLQGIKELEIPISTILSVARNFSYISEGTTSKQQHGKLEKP